MPMATFLEIFNGLFYDRCCECVPNLKFVPLPVPEIIGVTLKLCVVPEYAHAPFYPKFLMCFVRMDPMNLPATLEVRSYTRS